MAISDVVPVTSQLSATLEWLKWLVPLFVLGVLTWYGYVRAASGFFLIERIWRLIGGSKEFKDESLNAHWMEIRDLESFKYKTGIRFANYKKLRETLDWLDRNDISLVELIKVRRYFDPKEVRMRDPQLEKKKAWYLVPLLPLLLLVFLFFLVAIPDHAFLTVKESGTKMWANAESARSFDGYSWVVTSADCGVPTVQVSDGDKQLICELFGSRESQDFVKAVVRSQKALGLSFMAICLFFFLWAIFTFERMKEAQVVFDMTQPNDPD
jgi:hypothetical protein